MASRPLDTSPTATSPSPTIRCLVGTPSCGPRLRALGSTPFGVFEAVEMPGDSDVLPIGVDLLVVGDGPEAVELLDALSAEVAIVVVAGNGPGGADAAAVLGWLGHGAEDVLDASEWEAPGLPRRLLTAVERKRIERTTRTGYATDLDTGLPHQRQLMEHMSQLLALREREPAPMAVLALRFDGLAEAESRFGHGPVAALRRKIGVRLRLGVRASDVVASLGGDSYAVLLGAMLTPADADLVSAKLQRALEEPFKLSGEDVPLAATIGIARFPEDGTQPDALLKRAIGSAAPASA